MIRAAIKSLNAASKSLNANKKDGAEIRIEVVHDSKIKNASITIPADAIRLLGKAGVSLVVESPQFSYTLSKDVIDELYEAVGKSNKKVSVAFNPVKMRLSGDAAKSVIAQTVWSIDMRVGGKKMSTVINGFVKMSFNYAPSANENTDSLCVMLLKNRISVSKVFEDSGYEDGSVVWECNESGLYGIGRR